jgi:hypothetical protein
MASRVPIQPTFARFAHPGTYGGLMETTHQYQDGGVISLDSAVDPRLMPGDALLRSGIVN